jgi:hypothetical protein
MGDIISGIGSFVGGQQAASAARDAANLQAQRYYIGRSDLAPYNTTGQAALPNLLSLAQSGPTGGGTDYVKTAYDQYLPPQMTEAQLQQTPGYQWNLTQGLKATQSNAAAKGLGVSGAAMKGAATYATGLADSTYQQQFQNAQTRFSDVSGLSPLQQAQIQGQFGRLQNVASIGENAAAGTASLGASTGVAGGNALIAAGTAEAQGTKGLATGIGNTVNDIGGLAYNALTRPGGTSSYG